MKELILNNLVFYIPKDIAMNSIQSFYFVSMITLVSSAHVYGQKKDKMNVLFIIADDMRPELGCYGIEDIVTPHIDRLAEQATVFSKCIL